jgi:hypothetical protein
VVDAQGAGSVATGVVQPHQQSVGRLVERVVPEEPLGVGDGLARVAARLEQVDETSQRLNVASAQSLPLCAEPLLIRSGEEVAAVELDRFPQIGEGVARGCRLHPRHRLLEGGDIEPERSARPPLQRPRRRLEVPVGIGQGPSQVMEQVAQIGPRLRLGRVGPEAEGELLPRLRRLPVQHQIGQERLSPRRLERRQRGTIAVKLESAEEPDAKGRRVHGTTPWQL